MSFSRRSFAGAFVVALAVSTFANAQPTTASNQKPNEIQCTNKVGQSQTPKVVFQVNRAEDAPLILRFVTNYLKAQPDAEVTVVGYASGIDFMLKGTNDTEGKPYATQVNRLLEMGVNFKVCNNTLKARNATPDIVLANVGVVPSAVNEIVRLQTQEGYSYFRH